MNIIAGICFLIVGLGLLFKIITLEAMSELNVEDIRKIDVNLTSLKSNSFVMQKQLEKLHKDIEKLQNDIDSMEKKEKRNEN